MKNNENWHKGMKITEIFHIEFFFLIIGVSPFSPYFNVNKTTIKTDLFKDIKAVCKANADPICCLRMGKSHPSQTLEVFIMVLLQKLIEVY